MGTTARDQSDEFSGRYGVAGTVPFLAAEREALGSDYGANGYTTVAQADTLGAAVGLGRGDRLLDLGAGCGWPGLYLAVRHECAVISVDPVADGVVASAERWARDPTDRPHLEVIALGERLPFRPRSFDAIVHADVMC